MKTLCLSIEEYILNHQLIIDRGTYLTVIIGLLTVYAVALAFYQFAASFYGGNEKRSGVYLGINLVEYHMKKGLGIYSYVISSRLFWLFFAAAVLYVPLVSVEGKYFSEEAVKVFNFAWYAYCVFFFLFFVLFFSRCTRSVMALNSFTAYMSTENISRGEYRIILNINKKIKRNTGLPLNKRSIDLLTEKLDWIIAGIDGTDPKYTSLYIELIRRLMRDYIEDKQRKIERVLSGSKKRKSIANWQYDFRRESWLLKKLQNVFIAARECDKNIDSNNYTIKLHLKMLRLGMDIARAENYKNISFAPYSMDIIGEETFKCREWSELTGTLFEKGSLADKKTLIESFAYEGDDNKLTALYCEKTLKALIIKYMDKTFSEEFAEKDFVSIFRSAINTEKYNLIFAESLRDCMIADNKFEATDLIRLLDKMSCTYIFVYLLIFYSVYDFRSEWTYINIKMLDALMERVNNVEENRDEIDRLLKKSNINHRYKTEMLDVLLKNINERITWKWLAEIYRQNKIDPFYLTAVKLCVFNQMYQPYYEQRNLEAEILFINSLVKHPEIMKCRNVRDMIQMLHFEGFRKLTRIPSKLNITLRSLLLLGIYLTDQDLESEKLRYLNAGYIGQYFLVISVEYGRTTQTQKNYIKKAYEMSDKSVDEYMNNLYEECELCGKHLNHSEKEKLRRTLIDII